MANQPKKYKKFVATAATATLVASAIVPVASAASLSDIAGNTHEEAITSLVDAGVINGYPDGTFQPNKTLTRSDVVKLLGKYLVSKGLEVPADYKTNVRFNDLTSASNDELLKYAAVVYDAGVFNGSNGNLLAGDNITRENMAVVLVRAFDTLNNIDLVSYVQGQEYKKDVKDLYTAKSEARSAIEVLDFFDITNPAVANFNPKGSTTRGQFATFLYKTINTDFSAVTGVANSAVSAIKAINNTTVEVTFKETVENIEALDFTIEGLEVKNAVVKQTDAKTVVLTTAAQTGETVYTLNVNAAKAGTFTGVSAVIPTSVTMATPSVQGKLGQQVTLKAQVTVAEGQSKAGIPVTFSIPGNNNDAVYPTVIGEAITNAEGVATYTYTRYSATQDTATVYATGAPTVRSTGTVYWGVNTILEVVVDDKVGSALENTSVKQYKVIYKSPETGEPVANKVIDLTFEENVGVNADKLNNATINGEEVFQLLNGDKKTVEVRTNKDGEAVFYVAGENTTATPVAFIDEDADNILDARELRVASEKVTFAATSYKFEITSKTGENAAMGSGNGRTFEVAVTDKDGKAVQGRTVNVALNENIDNLLSTNTDAQVKATNVAAADQITLELDKNGKAKFTVFSEKLNDYATPVVWIDVANAGKLDSGEPNIVGEKTYFVKEAVVQNGGALKVLNADGDVKETFASDKSAYFEFSAQNQSGKVVSQAIKVSYTVKNTGASDLEVFEGSTLKATVAPGESKRVELSGNAGKTSLKVQPVAAKADKNGSVQVTAVGETVESGNVASINLGSKTATAKFTSITAVADIYTGIVGSIDTVEKELKFENKEALSYDGASFKGVNGNVLDQDAFEAVFAGNAQVKVTYRVDSNEKVSFEIISIGNSEGVTPDLSAPVTNTVSSATLGLTTVATAVSNDTNVVTVANDTSNVKLTAKDAGVATVTAKDAAGNTATIAVTVTKNSATGALTITAVPTAYDGTAPEKVTGLTFTDTDTDAGQVGGEITFTASTSTDVVSTVVKYGDVIINKDTAGKYTIAQDTPYTNQKITVTVTDGAGNSSAETIEIVDVISTP